MTVLSFIKKITVELENYEKMFVELHRYAIELEKNRNEAIKESLIVFINIMSNFFGEEKATMFRES